MRYKDQWAEEHGIHVGYCNHHKAKVWDETCDECDERIPDDDEAYTIAEAEGE